MSDQIDTDLISETSEPSSTTVSNEPDPEDVKNAVKEFLGKEVKNGTPEEFQALLTKSMGMMKKEFGDLPSDIAKDDVAKPTKRYVKKTTRAAKMAKLRQSK
jgi:hypothetical protein